MPRSPIPDALWTTMFSVGVAGMSAALLASFWNQHRAARAYFGDQWAILGAKRGTHAPEKLQDALRDIYNAVLEEKRFRRGTSILSVHDNARALMQHLHMKKDDEDSADTAALAVQLIILCFIKERETRTLLALNGGYVRLLALMCTANEYRNARVTDICAQALRDATSFEESELVLPTDIPEGCEGNYKLVQQSTIREVLRTLFDPEIRPATLEAMTAVIANLCQIRVGAQTLSAGIDGRTALEVFVNLLRNSKNATVRMHALRGICALLAHVDKDKLEFAKNVDILEVMASFVEPGAEPNVLEGVLKALLRTWDNTTGIAASRKAFLEAVLELDLVKKLVEVWTEDRVERLQRQRAQLLVKRLGTAKLTATAVEETMDAYAEEIDARGKKDAAEDKAMREMQERRAQEQEMMLRQMMQSGQMPPQMMAAMMGEE